VAEVPGACSRSSIGGRSSNQLAAKVRDVAPALRVGIVQAGRNETGADVICASVQTLASERRRRMVRGVGLLIVDECHHAAAPTYLAVLMEHYGCMPEVGQGHEGENALAAGYTATLTRSDARSLGEVWQKVSTTRDIAYGVREGFLVRPFGKHVAVANLDLAKVKTSRGDYQAADLGEAIEGSLAPEAIADALLEHAVLPDGRMRPTFLFAPLVSTAELIAKVLCERGIRAVAMHGATTAQERDKLDCADLANGALQVICNPMIFTEGTDVPAVSCVVVARPTKSKGLFIQMIGRALRPDRTSGKVDALILDVVGASRGNSLSLPVDLFGAEEAREKEELEGLEELDDLVADEQVELEDLAADESWLNGPLRTTDIDLFARAATAPGCAPVPASGSCRPVTATSRSCRALWRVTSMWSPCTRIGWASLAGSRVTSAISAWRCHALKVTSPAPSERWPAAKSQVARQPAVGQDAQLCAQAGNPAGARPERR
jgi:superfamily II DNA or RNA helicase